MFAYTCENTVLFPLVLITFLINLSKYPQNTNTVVAKFDIVLHRLTANAFFKFLVILDSNFKGKKKKKTQQLHGLILEMKEHVTGSPPDTVLVLVCSCQMLES